MPRGISEDQGDWLYVVRNLDTYNKTEIKKHIVGWGRNERDRERTGNNERRYLNFVIIIHYHCHTITME